MYFSMVTQLYMNLRGKDSATVLVYYAKQRPTLTSKIEVVLHHSIYAVKMVIMKPAAFSFWPVVSLI